MKTLVLLLTLIAIPAYAANVTFEWDANSESDLAGYKLYQSNTSGEYTDSVVSIPAGTETVMLPDITDGEYFWVLTALDTSDNESEYSDEVTLTIDGTPPEKPTGFRAFIQQLISWLRGIFGGFSAQVG